MASYRCGILRCVDAQTRCIDEERYAIRFVPTAPAPAGRPAIANACASPARRSHDPRRTKPCSLPTRSGTLLAQLSKGAAGGYDGSPRTWEPIGGYRRKGVLLAFPGAA